MWRFTRACPDFGDAAAETSFTQAFWNPFGDEGAARLSANGRDITRHVVPYILSQEIGWASTGIAPLRMRVSGTDSRR